MHRCERIIAANLEAPEELADEVCVCVHCGCVRVCALCVRVMHLRERIIAADIEAPEELADELRL